MREAFFVLMSFRSEKGVTRTYRASDEAMHRESHTDFHTHTLTRAHTLVSRDELTQWLAG